MTVVSKSKSLLSPITLSCCEYFHPYTASCTMSAAGQTIHAFQYILRTYSAVYLLSLLARGKVPSCRDLRRTVFAIMQSTAFLTTNAVSYGIFTCLIRNYWGSLNFYTISFVPSFLSSLSAIILERPSRHGLLCLYVTNVATETIYNMLVYRGIVPRIIKNGQVAIFGISVAALLYIYRRGLNERHTDPIYSIIRFAVGAGEQEISGIVKESPIEMIADDKERSSQAEIRQFDRRIDGPAKRLPFLLNAVQAYAAFIHRNKQMWRHPTCPHKSSCIYYVLESGVKLFTVGLGIQIATKMLPKLPRIFTSGPGILIRQLFSWDTVKLAIFFGGFSSLFRASSCSLRHTTGRDDPRFAIPSALLASVAFFSYPDTSVAMHAMLKMLQITYNLAVDRGYVPKIPYFTILMYCTSTALLFHAATYEPLALPPSYWKFLHYASGGRFAAVNRECLEQFGLESTKQLTEALRRTKTTKKIVFNM